METAAKFDQGKIKLELISPVAMQQLGRVLTKGAKKYAVHNWRLGQPWSKCIGSLKRHLNDYEMGIDYDVDPTCEACKSGTCTFHTGELQIAQILCNAMFLVEYYFTHKELDDRYKIDQTKLLSAEKDAADKV